MSSTAPPEAPQRPTALRRGLKPIAVFGTMFFLASDGPYGVELLVALGNRGRRDRVAIHATDGLLTRRRDMR